MAMLKTGGAAARLIVLVSATIAVLAASGPPPLGHIAGSSRKIRMYMVNAYLQLDADGSVSGAPDESPATVLQRSSVDLGQVKIQGVATCMYLCMDICGIPYASREFTDECVFNEMIEEHHYNTYSSAKYSNTRRTLYLGMNKKGDVRRVQIRTGTQLGKLSAYTRVLTHSVSPTEAATHGRIVCHPSHSLRPFKPRCRLRMPRKPRRRKKTRLDAAGGGTASEEPTPSLRRPLRRKCEEGTDCQKRLFIGRKRKSRLEATGGVAGQQQQRRVRHRKHRTAVRLKEEEEDEEDVTMTTDEDLLEDHTDLLMDIEVE